MNILRKLLRRKPKYDAVLVNCDLVMARDEIIGFHKIVNAEAEARGETALFKEEYATAWDTFRDNPTIDNARTLLEVSPPLLQYFRLCSPGGSLYSTNSYINKHGLK